MKSMKNIFKAGLLIALCLTLVFAFACGNDKGDDKKNPDNQGNTTQDKGDKITVTIDLGDGSTPATQEVKKGETAKAPYSPSRTGFTFKGWTVNGAAFDFETTPITEAITVVANWEMDPAVTPVIATQPESAKVVPYAGGSVAVTIDEVRGYVYSAKWYITEKNEATGGTLIEGQNEVAAGIPGNLDKNKNYWVYAEIIGTRNASGATASTFTKPIKIEFDDRTMTVLLVGSGVMHRTTTGAEHDSALFLQSLARASGKAVTVDKLTLGSNYNIWESGLVGDGYLNLQNMLEQRAYDFIVFQFGRDYALPAGTSTHTADVSAINGMYDLARKYNPGVQIVTLVSYARQDLSSKYYNEVYSKLDPVVTDRAGHSAAIETYWASQKDSIATSFIEVNANLAFEACLAELGINPWGNTTSDFADMNGSYLMACLMYAEIFGENPVGIMCFDCIEDATGYAVAPTDGVKMQALAAKLALGIETTTLPDVSGYTKWVDTFVDQDAPVKPEDIDPAYKYPTPTEKGTTDYVEPEEELNVLVFGGYPVGAYQMHKTLFEMIEKQEKKFVNYTQSVLEHTGSSTTFNIYEMFASANYGDSETAEWSGLGSAKRLATALESTSFDYLILQTGRDFSMEKEDRKAANVNSVIKFARLAAAKNPNVKLIIVAPYGHNADFTDFMGINNLQDHVPVINAEAEAARDGVISAGVLPAEQVKIAYVSNAFLNYGTADEITADLYQTKNVVASRANTGNRASQLGAYLAAATVYATMFDKSPVGMPEVGYSESSSVKSMVTDGAKLLKAQMVAHKTALGSDFTGTVADTTMKFFTNGGSAVAPITAPAGTQVEAPADPTKEGYKFAGWFYDQFFTNRYSFMFSTMPVGEITLYGAWAKDTGGSTTPPTPGTDPVTPPTPPASTLPEDDTAPVAGKDGKITAFYFGGMMFGSHDFMSTLKEMMAEGSGKEVVIEGFYLGHDNTSNSTYNLYELFDSSCQSSATDVVFKTTGNSAKCKEYMENSTYDVLILQMGRDFSMVEGNRYEQNVYAAQKLAKLALAKNPDCKILLVGPYGHQVDFADMAKANVKTHAAHTELINAEIIRAYNAIKKDGAKNVEVVSIASLFECYSTDANKIKTDLFREMGGKDGRGNFGNRASAKGSYLAAAGVYAAMFDKSPVGLTTLGFILKDDEGNTTRDNSISAADAAEMQKLANDFVLGDLTPGTKPTEPEKPVEPEKPAEPAADTLNVFVWGGQMMGSYYFTETLGEMLEQGTGKHINLIGSWLGHYTTDTTWNSYELFASSARSSLTDFTFGSGSGSQKVYNALKDNKIDYLVLQAGRDFTLVEGGGSDTKANISYAKIVKMAVDNNPDVKVIIVAPYGHQTDYADMKGPTVANHKEHVALIDKVAQTAVDFIKANTAVKNIELVSVGSLFEAYSTDAAAIKADLFRADDGVAGRKNVGNRATAKGAYLAAAGVYAAMLDKSPEGLTTYGYIAKNSDDSVKLDCSISEADAKAMQKLANEYVLNGKGEATVPQTPPEKPVEPDTPVTPEPPSAAQAISDVNGNGKLDVFFFGNGIMSSYNMSKEIVDMLKLSTGMDVSYVQGYLGHTSGSAFNLYELFSARTDPADYTFTTGSTATALKGRLEGEGLDCIILQTGREYSLNADETRQLGNITSAVKIAELAYKQNSKVKLVLVAPYSFEADYSFFTKVNVKDPVAHAALINEEVNKIRDAILAKVPGMNLEVVYLSDLFNSSAVNRAELYRESDGKNAFSNAGNRTNAVGSYLVACTIFSAITDKSPVGMDYLGLNVNDIDGTVSKDVAEKMQKIAADFTKAAASGSTTPTTPPTTDPEKPDNTVEGAVNVFIWGGQMMSTYGYGQTLKAFIEEGTGKPVNLLNHHLGHGNTSTTWNAWELFASSATSSYTDFTLGSGKTATTIKEELETVRLDYLILQTGRDLSLATGGTRDEHAIIAIAKLAKMAADKNPDVQIILVAPYGHQTDYSDMTLPVVKNHKEHVALINEEAALAAGIILDKGYAKNVKIVSVGNVFEAYSTDAEKIKTDLFCEPNDKAGRGNTGNRGSALGTYLAAAATYTVMYGKSPVGAETLGYIEKAEDGSVTFDCSISADAAAEMQALAAKILTDEVKGKLEATGPKPVEYPDETVEGAVNILAFGGYTLGSYNMLGTLYEMIEIGTGKPLNSAETWLSHTSTATTYNVYELIESSNRDSMDSVVFSSYGEKFKQKLNSTKLDYLILDTGRDQSVFSATNNQRNIKSIAKFAKMAVEKNPDVQIILVAPYGHQMYWNDFQSMETPINDTKAHVAAINDVAQQTAQFIKDQKITDKVTVICVGSLFETYNADNEVVKADLYREENEFTHRGNWGNRASAKGSYLAACGVYAAMFQKSPVGLGTLGAGTASIAAEVDVYTAIAMQKLATKFVLGTDVDVSSTFTVKFETFGGTAIESITGEMGEAFTAPEDPTKEGLIFKGWYADPGFEEKFDFEGATIPFGGQTIYARFLTEQEAARPDYWVPTGITELQGKKVTVMMVGSGQMAYASNNFNSAAVLEGLLKKAGYDAEVRSRIYGNSYNLYGSDGNTIMGENYSIIRDQLADGEVDFLVVQLNRDYATVYESTLDNDTKAINNLVAFAKQFNPDLKVIVMVPYPRRDNVSGEQYRDYYNYGSNALANFGISTPEQLSVAINKTLKEKTLAKFTFDPIIVNVNNAFNQALSEGINPWFSMTDCNAGPEGGYLMGCCLYAGITGKSPVGVMRFSVEGNEVKPTVGAKLQAIAAQSVLEIRDATPVYVTDNYVERSGLNVLIAAGEEISANGMEDILKNIAGELGKEVSITTLGVKGSIETVANSTALKNQLLYSGVEYDYIIVEAGKDAVLYNEAAFNAEKAALDAVRELAVQNYKDAKVMVIAPMARQNTTSQYFKDQVVENGIATRTDYAALIEANTKKLAGENDVIINLASVADACTAQGFSTYTNTVSDAMSEDGTYVVACTIFAELFTTSPATEIYRPISVTEAEKDMIATAIVALALVA